MTQDELEKKVIEKLLSGQDNNLQILRQQYKYADITARDFTELGFILTFEFPNNLPQELLLGQQFGTIFGVAAKYQDAEDNEYFVLHISNGRFNYLEGFAIGGTWRADYENAAIVCTLPEGKDRIQLYRRNKTEIEST